MDDHGPHVRASSGGCQERSDAPIFAARFVTGVRFLAGPLAGAAGVPPLTFTIANVLGALAYVPYAVGIGYGVGWGFGDAIQRLVARRIDHIVLGVLVAITLGLGAIRLLRARPR
jgi:membrane protein DedA with SNARE-associated domain